MFHNSKGTEYKHKSSTSQLSRSRAFRNCVIKFACMFSLIPFLLLLLLSLTPQKPQEKPITILFIPCSLSDYVWNAVAFHYLCIEYALVFLRDCLWEPVSPCYTFYHNVFLLWKKGKNTPGSLVQCFDLSGTHFRYFHSVASFLQQVSVITFLAVSTYHAFSKL